jgi:hypothetical protein
MNHQIEGVIGTTSQVYEWIKARLIEDNGRPPTIRDILLGSNGDISSTSVVVYHINKLRSLGLLEQSIPHGDARSLSVTGGLYLLPVNVLDNIPLTDNKTAFIIGDYKMGLAGAADELAQKLASKNVVAIVLGTHRLVASVYYNGGSWNGGEIRAKTHNWSPLEKVAPVVTLLDALQKFDLAAEETAIITNDKDYSIAAIALGLPVYPPEEVAEWS